MMTEREYERAQAQAEEQYYREATEWRDSILADRERFAELAKRYMEDRYATYGEIPEAEDIGRVLWALSASRKDGSDAPGPTAADYVFADSFVDDAIEWGLEYYEDAPRQLSPEEWVDLQQRTKADFENDVQKEEE